MPDGFFGATRRDFFKQGAAVVGAFTAFLQNKTSAQESEAKRDVLTAQSALPGYRDARLSRVAFPMGGIGAGMICLEGTGALSHVSLQHRPAIFNEPCIFAAIAVTRNAVASSASMQETPTVARVLEGPVPGWKLFGHPGAGRGCEGASYGLPRFADAAFVSRFPFGTVTLTDPVLPVSARITGWSPFVPGDADHSSLPVAALEYTIINITGAPIDGVFSFNAKNFMGGTIGATHGGFVCGDAGAACAIFTNESSVAVNHAWFRGDWWDPMTMAWNDVIAGKVVERAPISAGEPPAEGATLAVPFKLAAHAERTIVVQFAWYVPTSTLRLGADLPGTLPEHTTYVPWYATQFPSHTAVTAYWRAHYAELRSRTQQFTTAFYDTTLPTEVVEAVAANLSILKSPTTMRQADGRLWLWEGCNDDKGSCAGSCTHVWNYAQAIAHLFPSLERTLRETEFGESLSANGYQVYRAALPIRPQRAVYLPAADGQLGGILKIYRDWRISGDTEWLRRLWPRVQLSLDYCIGSWDPRETGTLEAPHHNTYDIEFCGPDSMCTSFYLGALKVSIQMGKALGTEVSRYQMLYDRGVRYTETQLYNGEYFFQRVDASISSPAQAVPADAAQEVAKPSVKAFPEERILMEREGPKYQYGTGCLSDGVIGAWMAQVCGVGDILDPDKVTRHVTAVHTYNFKPDLSAHANTQRPAYAANSEGGLLLCTWPHGNKPSLPFVYSDEVWTGIEYQVASHLMMLGHVDKGLDIVRACRARYDGRVRNPYNEYECGHWYGRALSSYAMLQALSGARYDAVEKTLYLRPAIRGDFRAFLSTATGFGTVGVRQGKPFLEVVVGTIEVQQVRYAPAIT